MTLFWTLAGALMLLTAVFILSPLFRSSSQLRPHASGPGRDSEQASQDEINLQLFRQQMAELDADLANGKIAPDQHQSAKLELERELLHDVGDPGASAPEHGTRGRWLIPLLAIAVPALALGVYRVTGTPEIIPRLASAGQHSTPHGQGEMPSLDVLAERLSARMEQNPADLEGWMMLGRTYFALGQPAQALAALEQAYALAPDEPEVKLTYAEALAANHDNQLEGKPAELISEVLATNPDHLNARWLNGVLSFQRGQYTAAIRSWQGILEQTDPASQDAEDLRNLIEEARKRGGLEPLTRTAEAQTGAEASQPALAAADPATAAQLDPGGQPDGPSSTAASQAPDAVSGQPPQTQRQSPAAGAGGQLLVEVEIAEAFRGQVPPQAAVFVYAKAAAGPPMPLAVRRLSAAQLPTSVTLDDSMAMTPAMKLSSFDQVIVGARVSKSGQAMPMPGDLQGETSPIRIGSAGLEQPVPIVIDEQLR